MSSKTSVSYAFYFLYPKQYVDPPAIVIKGCPQCAGALSKSSISPSKAVTSFLDSATMPYHNFSYLYKCPTCQWWAVWESFGDAEYSPDYSFLIASLSNDDQVSVDKPWKQALENENVYDRDRPLPKSLEQVLVGKKRILDLPKPGDKVFFMGDVHMLRDPEAIPFDFVPLFIGGSEGIVVDDEQLYDLIKAQHFDLEPEYTRNLLIRLKANLNARNCCPIRLEKLVVSDRKQRHNSCKEGVIYFIDAADIMRKDE